MFKKLLCKCFISLGLLLIFTTLIPFTAAQAASIEIEKEGDYKLNLKSITLAKGTTYTLKVYNLNESAKVLYKSDDEEVASVSENGEITAVKVGTTIVTATVKDGITITKLPPCEIIVGLPAFSVKLTKSRMIIGLEKTDFLNVILKPSNTVESARFSSNEVSIASVSTGGRITAKGLGLTYVFAKIDALNADLTRKTSRCTVIVTKPEDAPLLETYFNDHPDFDLVPEEDFEKALYEFFNTKYDKDSTSLVDSLNSHLNDKFAKLIETKKADLAKLQTNSLEVKPSN